MQPNNTAVARVDDAALTSATYFGDQLAEMNEVMRVNLGGSALFDIKDITKIPFPGAGAGAWKLPGIDKARNVEEFEGVILAWQTHRGHYAKVFEGGNEAPDCWAEEPAEGEAWHGNVAFNGKFGGACAKCPLGQWKIDGDRKIAPLCKPRIRVYVQTREIALPVWIDLPSTSVPVFKDYMKALTRFGFPHYRVVTIFGLESVTSVARPGAKKGIDYAKLKPRAAREEDGKTVFRFSTHETVQIVERRNAILAMIDPAKRAARRLETAAQGEAEAPPDSAAAAFGIDGDL